VLGADGARAQERPEVRDRHGVEVEVQPALGREDRGAQDVRARVRGAQAPVQGLEDAHVAAARAQDRRDVDAPRLEAGQRGELGPGARPVQVVGVVQHDALEAAPVVCAPDRERVDPGQVLAVPDEVCGPRDHAAGRAASRRS
jgi:hypothetical protein